MQSVYLVHAIVLTVACAIIFWPLAYIVIEAWKEVCGGRKVFENPPRGRDKKPTA